ncbi:hypothetical protein WJX81_006872 [Elliptochloris bilobata]|uniref:Histone deacetylase domain-containing protein n=1 Tax=Elliptochloris bilobata TaxID=381761 RepID=A0AAW1RTI2_9CHLO
MFDSDEDSDVEMSYVLHNACEAGDVTLVRQLLERRHVADGNGLAQVVLPEPELDINEKDEDGCSPLFVSLLNGQLECAHALLEAGARVGVRCEGSGVLHAAVCVAALPGMAGFGAAAVQLLVEHGAAPADKDDHGRTALHWVAASGLCEAAEALDKQGNTALHLAARSGHAGAVEALLAGPGGAAAAARRNRAGQLPLHAAAGAGAWVAATALLRAAPAATAQADRRGLTPAQWAIKRGHTHLAAALAGGVPDGVLPTGDFGSDGVGGVGGGTLMVAPEECLAHRTAPEPFVRGGRDPPPENVNRLHVLTHVRRGILRGREFARLRWEGGPLRAALADVLRVHEWAYVRALQQACGVLAEGAAPVGHLDGDTAISAGTFGAALAAAGAVCRAVDRVIAGEARNAFCAVRPPGHHAGPVGIVTCANDPHGSLGFCLLNNLAIGAAYAVSMYRAKGIRRVALLDFDVHHGNGTQACVGGAVPGVAKYSFKTPTSEGVQTFPVFRPWLDFDDADNILFASVQGYGRRTAAPTDGWIYPGSGATADSRHPPPPPPPSAEHLEPGVSVNGGAGGNTLAAGAAGGLGGKGDPSGIEEDPEAEFVGGDAERPPSSGPRVINVGIPGPGADVPMWRRAWRDKILPAVVRFNPDLVLVSAGFDAHRKDDMNFRYIGIQERDFEWLTDQIVQVANRCCSGRVVSVLEGGYRIQGACVSAFARSVAAHVRALQDPNHQVWDPEDARWEREREAERRRRAEAEAAEQAAAAAAVAAAAEEAAIAAATAAAQTAAGVGSEESASAADAAPAAAGAAPAVADAVPGDPVAGQDAAAADVGSGLPAEQPTGGPLMRPADAAPATAVLEPAPQAANDAVVAQAAVAAPPDKVPGLAQGGATGTAVLREQVSAAAKEPGASAAGASDEEEEEELDMSNVDAMMAEEDELEG